MKVAAESYWGLVASGEGGSGGVVVARVRWMSKGTKAIWGGGRGRSRRRRRSAEWGARYDDGGTSGEGVSE